MNIGYHSNFMDRIIERANKRQERMENEPMTNEEWLRSCPPQELIRFLMNVAYGGQIRNVQKRTFDEEAEKWSKWLKEKHTE